MWIYYHIIICRIETIIQPFFFLQDTTCYQVGWPLATQRQAYFYCTILPIFWVGGMIQAIAEVQVRQSCFTQVHAFLGVRISIFISVAIETQH